MTRVTAPIANLKGIGKVTIAALHRLGVKTFRDLVYHFPTHYEDFTNRQTVAAVPLDQPVTLHGTVAHLSNRRSWRRRRLIVTEGLFQDATGALKLVWFGQPFIAKAIPEGKPLRIAGSIERRDGTLQMANPAWERDDGAPIHTARLVPHYALTRGVSGKQIRALAAAALRLLPSHDYFAPQFLRTHHLVGLRPALRSIHFPASQRDLVAARRRLAFDEFFLLQLSRTLARRRRQTIHAPAVVSSLDALLPKLPLSLTADQRVAAAAVLADLGRPFPMRRLLEGEVGSGKTAVSAVAAAAMAEANYQALYLAPTAVLARQQYETLARLLHAFGIDLALLTSAEAETTNGHTGRVAVRRALATGEVAVAVGTHALLQRPVNLPRLGLVVVDEQHRFGVLQRQAAQGKGTGLTPHVLAMTATPIPRTLQLAFMGDVDVSLLRSMPHGKRQVTTMLFGPADRPRVEAALRRRIARGEQVFVVCPLIDPSDKLGVRSATAEYKRLRQEVFRDVAIGLLHGKLRPEEKANVLADFRERKLSMLVATSVIEVGVDIPEATIMVIEGAERFGLAQLHQLRGRVGRRGKEGVCALFAESPSAGAAERLKLFAVTDDGFHLAEADLKLRGPGDWFGLRQSGFPELQVANLSDVRLLTEAERTAAEVLTSDPTLSRHRDLRDELARQFPPEYAAA